MKKFVSQLIALSLFFTSDNRLKYLPLGIRKDRKYIKRSQTYRYVQKIQNKTGTLRELYSHERDVTLSKALMFFFYSKIVIL